MSQNNNLSVENEIIKDNTSRFRGAPWFERMTKTNVLVAGVGGIGSYFTFLLSRLSPSEIFIYDPDIVESVNMSGQLYGLDDIGNSKVYSMASYVNRYSDFLQILAVKRKYNPEVTRDIMVCGFDNMKSRKQFYKAWRVHLDKTFTDPTKCLFIDGRLAAEEFQVLAIQGNDKKNMERYEKEFLFSDEEADPTICSYKQTSHCATMIASFMINILVNFISNLEEGVFPRNVPFYTEYMSEIMRLNIEQ